MNNELPKTKIDERTGIEYHLEGDYYIPNLVMPEQEKITLNKYGRMRLRYFKEHKKAEYTILLVNNKLQTHLIETDESANKRFELLMQQLAGRENITEELKANNQMEWVAKMNNIKNRVEEIIFNELIYV